MSRLVAFTCCVFLAFFTQAQAATGADFAADFSASSNPASGWSYGSTTSVSGPFSLLTDKTTFASFVKAWTPAGTTWPTIALNTSNATVAFGAGDAIVLAAGQGLLHPGPTGAFADVRYTASSDFSGVFNVSFSGIDQVGTTTDVHVLLNGVSLASGLVGAYGQVVSFSSPVTLGAGDHLDFLVGWGSNSNYIDDSTGFSASLTSASTGPAPEPAAWTLMILGVGGLGVALRRNRQKTAAMNAKVRPRSY